MNENKKVYSFSNSEYLSTMGKINSKREKVASAVHGNKNLQSTLVECGWGATKKKDGFINRKYQSLDCHSLISIFVF